MTIRLSSGMRDAVVSNYGIGAVLFGGHIQVFTGPQPASADMPPSGTLLARITQDGADAPGAGGLRLQLGVNAGELCSDGAWVIKGVASGIPGWWRFVGADPDDGQLSTSVYRMDGTVAEATQDMPTLVSLSTATPLAGFTLTFPND